MTRAVLQPDLGTSPLHTEYRTFHTKNKERERIGLCASPRLVFVLAKG